MLLFYCASEADLDAIRREGVPPGDDAPWWRRLEDAACDGPVLVADASRLAAAVPDGPDRLRVAGAPPGAFVNLDPYLPPRSVTAAGGFVMRPGTPEPDVLLIFRRGLWDLPKGKLDPGESVEAAALREVREEVGLGVVHLRRALGATVHGYPERGSYRVKTTHWFLMETPERTFTPQADEDIEAARWVPWGEAQRRVGYASLRAHMAEVEPLLRAEAWLYPEK